MQINLVIFSTHVTLSMNHEPWYFRYKMNRSWKAICLRFSIPKSRMALGGWSFENPNSRILFSSSSSKSSLWIELPVPISRTSRRRTPPSWWANIASLFFWWFKMMIFIKLRNYPIRPNSSRFINSNRWVEAFFQPALFMLYKLFLLNGWKFS